LGSDFTALLQQLAARYQLLVSETKQQFSQAELAGVNQVVEQQLQQLQAQLTGISLLRCCPDHIKAQLLGLGEQFSVALMTALLNAKQVQAIALDAVSTVKSSGDYL